MTPRLQRFAPPDVAIEIATGRVTVAGMTVSGGRATVTAFASEPVPAEAVTPALAGPNVPATDVVADALRRALARAGLRSVRRAALVVPDSIARVSLLPLESLPAKAADVESLVRWQLRKATPFPMEEAQVSHFVVHAEGASRTLAALVARRDVVAKYEAVTTAAGIHPGLVDLASFSIMNVLLGAGAAERGDALVVCLAAEATTLAILRGPDLMFYRHRSTIDEPLGALVHQTAMYHEDRLGGGTFAHVYVCGATAVESVRREIGETLGLAAEAVDLRRTAALPSGMPATADVLDALAAPIGALVRERKAA